MKTLGFIGTGGMGSGMAANLIKAGYRLVVNDLRREQARGLEGQGAQFKDSPKAVAESCELVLSMLPNNVGGQPTYRMGDLSNPNLKPWVKEWMKKDNDEVLAGKIGYTARSSCAAAGVPGFLTYPVRPVYFIQTPKQVAMIYSGDAQVRRIYLNVPHSENPKSTWYGESVGHYEGDMLVVDTIGMNDKTFLDNYRTPHTTKLHVVERWKMVEEGKTLQVTITVEDPDAFNEPWWGVRRYRRVQEKMGEEICAENNQHLFDYQIPIASKPDF